MKLNIDFTNLEISREQMESLYRTRSSAEAAVKRAADDFDQSAQIVEVNQSVEGRPARDFFKVIYL